MQQTNKQTNNNNLILLPSFLPSFFLSFFLSYLPSSDVHSVCNWVVLQNTNQSPHNNNNNRKRKRTCREILFYNTVELSEQIRSQISGEEIDVHVKELPTSIYNLSLPLSLSLSLSRSVSVSLCVCVCL